MGEEEIEQIEEEWAGVRDWEGERAKEKLIDKVFQEFMPHGTTTHQVIQEKRHDGKLAKILYFRNVKYEQFWRGERWHGTRVHREEGVLLAVQGSVQDSSDAVTLLRNIRAGNTWRTFEGLSVRSNLLEELD